MPEGPETHRQAQKLRDLLLHQIPVLGVEYPALQGPLSLLQGQRVTAVEAKGKAFLIEFESRQTLYAHMQLYGRWQMVRTGHLPKTNRQLRLRLGTTSGDALLYSATDLLVLSPAQRSTHPYLSRLGPDLLAPESSPQILYRQLLDRRFSGRQLSGLLLDQSFWAGPGNYLRSEILFCAGLTPQTRPKDLTPLAGERLAFVAQGLARRSLLTGGLTQHPLNVQPLKAQKVPRRQYRHWVFGRAQQPCGLCGQAIVKEDWNGRRLYRCSGCPGGGGLSLDFSEVQ